MDYRRRHPQVGEFGGKGLSVLGSTWRVKGARRMGWGEVNSEGELGFKLGTVVGAGKW